MNKFSEFLKGLFTPGTTQCAFAYGVIGLVLGSLLLIIGFWRTLFLLAFVTVGAMLGGIGNKKDAVREVINRTFPPKDEPLPKEIYEELKNANKPDESEQE